MSVKKVLGAWLLLACVVMGSVQLSAAELPESAQKYFELAKEGKDEAAMKKLGDTALTDVGKESEALNEFAWKILTDDGLKSRDLVFAMKVARRRTMSRKERMRRSSTPTRARLPIPEKSTRRSSCRRKRLNCVRTTI